MSRCANFNEKVAEWFAAKAEAAIGEDQYEISLELPGVAVADIEVVVQEGSRFPPDSPSRITAPQ